MWQLAWPWMLLLAPLPWFVRRFMRAEYMGKDAALRVPVAAEFDNLFGAGSGRGAHRRRLLLLWLIWILILLAAARPQYVGQPQSLPMTGRDLLLAVDLSGSMEEQDFQLDGRWVDRLTATKAIAKEFIERRIGDRIGLILFGREAYLQTPLTFDRTTIQILLDEAVIGLAGQETAIGDAIGLGIRTLTDAEIAENRRVFVLLTDGANTAGSIDPLKAAELARDRGMVIYTIGIGADSVMVQSLFGVREVNPSADLDERTLTTIAEGTGGRYFRARDTEAFQQIYAILDELEPAAADESGYRPILERYHWPLGVALLLGVLWALAGLRGTLKGSVFAAADHG